MTRSLPLFLLFSLTTAPAYAGPNKAANAELQRAYTASMLRAAQLEALLQESVERIEQLEETIRLQGRSQADRLENMDQVNAEVQRLRGDIEVLQFTLEEMKRTAETHMKTQERRQVHDEKRLESLEHGLGVTPPPPPTAAELGFGPGDTSTTDASDPDQLPPDNALPPNPGDEPDEAPPPADAQGKLELAIKHLEADSPQLARAVLRKAQKEHPDAPVADEVAYRIAESWFNEGNFRKAALSFKNVMDDHPKSPWAPWALYRQGECFEEMGQADNAKLFYKGVVQKYAKSEAAKKAKEKLK